MIHGFLVVDKPRGISSREAVDRVQAAFPKGTRVGHTGTLDPLASGVLVLALGQATRLTDYVQRQAKEYRAGLRFGAVSATDDAEGPIEAVDGPLPTRAALVEALDRYVGTISQTPPAFSAAHVGGQRAYRIARKGQTVELKPKPVRIDRIELDAYQPPDAEMTIVCGKGTYIRSLARDLGRDLACGAYLTSLRRLRVGSFRAEESVSIDASRAAMLDRLRPLVDAIHGVPRLAVAEEICRRLAMGQSVPTAAADESEMAIVDGAGNLRALAEALDGRLRPLKVFGQASP